MATDHGEDGPLQQWPGQVTDGSHRTWCGDSRCGDSGHARQRLSFLQGVEMGALSERELAEMDDLLAILGRGPVLHKPMPTNVLVMAVVIPDIEPDDGLDPLLYATNFVLMLNEERDRNGGPSPHVELCDSWGPTWLNTYNEPMPVVGRSTES